MPYPAAMPIAVQVMAMTMKRTPMRVFIEIKTAYTQRKRFPSRSKDSGNVAGACLITGECERRALFGQRHALCVQSFALAVECVEQGEIAVQLSLVTANGFFL